MIHHRSKNDNTKAVLQAHHENAGFFEKDNNVGENRRQRKRGRPNMGWIDFIKEAIDMSLKKLIRAVKDTPLQKPFIHSVIRRQN